MTDILKRAKNKMKAIGWKYIKLNSFECGFTAITSMGKKVYVEPSEADSHLTIWERDCKTFIKTIKMKELL